MRCLVVAGTNERLMYTRPAGDVFIAQVDPVQVYADDDQVKHFPANRDSATH